VAGIRVRSVPVPQTRALRHSILRPHQPIAQTLAAEPDGAHAVGAFDGTELIAAGLIARDPKDEPGSWRVRGMATTELARGRGAGTAVLAALLDHARARSARRVWCNVRTPARSLYERAGFKTVSEEFELPGIGPHFLMELTLGGRCDGTKESVSASASPSSTQTAADVKSPHGAAAAHRRDPRP
jgi:GNAT superfamily N-acetyltransferase